MFLKRLKKYFIQNWQFSIVIFLAIIFFFATSSFNYLIHDDDFVKWGSPDETANYFFTKLYSETDNPIAYEEYNLYADDIIRPRSFRSDFGSLKPVSFLGIILIYGKIAALTSNKIIPFLTPIFGAIGIIFYYLFIKKLFSKNIAFASVIILSSFPVYIYYSVRSMFHNVLFIVLLIIGLYFALEMAGKKYLQPYQSSFMASLAGFFIGLAIITRVSELIWIAPMILFLLIFNFKKIGITKILFFSTFMFLALLPAFYWNQILYNSPWQGGYPEMNQTILNIIDSGSTFVKSTINEKNIATGELEKIESNIFYFGLHSYQSFIYFINYFLIMFPLIAAPSMLGLFLIIQDWKKLKKSNRSFIIVYIFISLILILYYGSWQFNDNPDVSQTTIGNSYTRYWLPIYLCAIPLAGLFIERFTKEIFTKQQTMTSIGKHLTLKSDQFIATLNSIDKNKVKIKFKKFISPYLKLSVNKNYYIIGAQILFIGLIISNSIQFVLIGSDEGLIQTYDKYKNLRKEYDKILNLTEKNSIIITTYHDKLFFPQRKVIIGLFDDKKMITQYSNITQIAPLYYYNFTLPQKSVDYLNNSRLAEFSLQINKITEINDFSLYKLESKKIDISKFNFGPRFIDLI